MNRIEKTCFETRLSLCEIFWWLLVFLIYQINLTLHFKFIKNMVRSTDKEHGISDVAPRGLNVIILIY